MLQGKAIRLRPITEKDLETLWERHTELRDRGDFFPLRVVSKALKDEFLSAYGSHDPR